MFRNVLCMSFSLCLNVCVIFVYVFYCMICICVFDILVLAICCLFSQMKLTPQSLQTCFCLRCVSLVRYGTLGNVHMCARIVSLTRHGRGAARQVPLSCRSACAQKQLFMLRAAVRAASGYAWALRGLRYFPPVCPRRSRTF